MNVARVLNFFGLTEHMPTSSLRRYKELEELVVSAGFTGCDILGEMHAYRANDPREDGMKQK